MSETLSAMLPLGTPLPPFLLPDVVTGRWVDGAAEGRGKGLLVAFLCNHCPFVRHIRQEWLTVAHSALDEGLAVVAVSSNDPEAYPEDGPAPMRALAQEEGWRFPYLFDESQEAARAFHATCTPDFFLFDRELRLVYRGQFDDSRPGNGKPITGVSLRAALGSVLEESPIDFEQRPSIGCNIKWKPDSTSHSI